MSLSGRALAQHAWGAGFNPQYCKTTTKHNSLCSLKYPRMSQPAIPPFSADIIMRYTLIWTIRKLKYEKNIF